METKGKNLVIFIPYQDRSIRKLGEDCIANGRELFAAVKKAFESKKEVRFGKNIITSALLVSDDDNNRLKDIKPNEESIVIIHAFGQKKGEYLRDDNRGEIAVEDVIRLLETLIGDSKISEYHFAVCYSATEGNIAELWKKKHPETPVYGKKGKFNKDSVLFKEKEGHLAIHTGTRKIISD